MRRKQRPRAPQLREELAEERDRLAEHYVSMTSPELRAVGASYARRAQAIRDGAEVRLSGWQVPAWARGRHGMYEALVLGTDDVLRHDPSRPSY